MAIQPSGSKPPLFCIHGAGGDVLFYYNLVRRHWSPEQPVYGLQAQGLNGKHVFYKRIEDMAADYIREIRTVQPEGPYFLGGYSFGGTVAFEMAQQLHAQGQLVALLALIDTYGQNAKKLLPVHIRIFRHLANLLQLEPNEKLAYIRTRDLISNLNSDNERKSYLLKVYKQADKDYLPQVYPGRAILFEATAQPTEWCSITPQLGWDGLIAGGLEIYKVPGSHTNLFSEPYVQVLAEKLKACLDQAQSND